VTDKPPQTKWATGSNLAFVSYAADPERNLVIAMGVVDNLGKGAAGQAGAECEPDLRPTRDRGTGRRICLAMMKVGSQAAIQSAS
jgi:hypothetical protein